MKRILLIITLLTCMSCEIVYYDGSVTECVISAKEFENDGVSNYYYFYLQTTTSTSKVLIDHDTYSKYNPGDTLKILTKYYRKQ